MHNDKLKKAFEAIHDIPAINSQGEPDIDYVKWLEDLIDVYQTISKKSSDISPIIDRILSEMTKDVHHVNTNNTYSEEYRKGYNEANRNLNVIIKQIKSEESI